MISFNQISKNKSLLNSFINAVIPLVFILTGISFFHALGAYYLRAIDPEYAYLFNGLTVARLRFELGHIDHPGTPLQIIIALVIWIVQLFNNHQSMVENVISNPELYLKITFYVVLSINVIALFYLGKTATLIQGKLSGLLLQIMPFTSIIFIAYLERVRPINFQFSILAFLFILCLYYIDKGFVKWNQEKFNRLFAILVAVSLSLKISSFPIILVPFFLITERKNKFRFVLYTIVLFFLFSFPILIRHHKFFEWISDLFIHSGRYGRGNSNIVDLSIVITNFKTLYQNNRFLYIVQVFTFIYIFGGLLLKQYLPSNSGKYLRLLTGLLVTVILQTLLVVKHFALHYFIPFNLIHIFQLWIMITLMINSLNKKLTLLRLSYLLIFMVLAIIYFPKILNERKNQLEKLHVTEKSIEFMNTIPDSLPIFIYGEGYGDPYPQVALYFGCLWSGRYKDDYKKNLQQNYPDTYLYDFWYKKFLFWSDTINTTLLKSELKNSLLFLGKDDEETRKFIIGKLYKTIAPDTLSLDLLYKNDEKNEAFYMIEFKER